VELTDFLCLGGADGADAELVGVELGNVELACLKSADKTVLEAGVAEESSPALVLSNLT